jgi:hypothetical protein
MAPRRMGSEYHLAGGVDGRLMHVLLPLVTFALNPKSKAFVFRMEDRH